MQIPMIGSFTGHYVGEVLDKYQWPGEFHRTLRAGGSIYILTDGSFTGHYKGELLDTYQ